MTVLLSLHTCNTQLKEVEKASGRQGKFSEFCNTFKLGRETILNDYK